jgi:propanol-preferring alcohol dehydrogenase
MPATMKAAVLRTFGGPLTIDEVRSFCPVEARFSGAVDVDDAKLAMARRHGAAVTVNAAVQDDPAAEIRRRTGGGAQGVLVTTVFPKAFQQALGMAARGGTVVLNGLPPGDFPISIFDTVLNGLTIRGSIVGTRLDLQEALDFEAAHKVKASVTTARLRDINEILERLGSGTVEGRVVLDLSL